MPEKTRQQEHGAVLSSDRPIDRPTVSDLRFALFLDRQWQGIKKSRSGDKSRLRLAAAGAGLLDATSYRDLNVEDICAAAELAKGTFYIYYTSKDMFLEELARQYVDFELTTYPPTASGGAREGERFAAVRALVGWYERIFAANHGILRCMVQMGGQSPTMQALWHQRNHAIVERSVQGLRARHDIPDGDLALVRLAVRTAGGMLDQSLFAQFSIQVSPGFSPDLDPELVIDFHAILLHRAIYGVDPSIRDVGRAKSLLASLTLN